MTLMAKFWATAVPRSASRLREVWGDAWHLMAGDVPRILAGETIFNEAAERPLLRNGEIEIAWLSVCYSPVRDESGKVAGIFATVIGRTRTPRRGAAARERGALPADRRFRAGPDLGDQARPPPRLRQSRLSRFRRRQLRSGARSSTGAPCCIRKMRRASSPNRWPARQPENLRARGALPSRRWRMALAALDFAAALGTVWRAYRLHRRRSGHHRMEARRTKAARGQREAGESVESAHRRPARRQSTACRPRLASASAPRRRCARPRRWRRSAG